jgi:hypothetical protein
MLSENILCRAEVSRNEHQHRITTIAEMRANSPLHTPAEQRHIAAASILMGRHDAFKLWRADG